MFRVSGHHEDPDGAGGEVCPDEVSPDIKREVPHHCPVILYRSAASSE